jgi:hypothetical protein
VITEDLPQLGPKQLIIRTCCSLVSTGTELKIFRGHLDSDEPADLTISGMSEKLAYPLRYGYCLVGKVCIYLTYMYIYLYVYGHINK